MSRFELIDRAFNVVDFDNQATELTYALNDLHKRTIYLRYNSESSNSEKRATFNGYELILDMIEANPQLIQPSLYHTMKAVRKQYQQLSKSNCNHSEMNAVSLACHHLNHVKKLSHFKGNFGDY